MVEIRDLAQNQQPIFYKLYEGQNEIVDEWGNSTGSYEPVYSALKSAMLSVSPNKGTSETDQFGTFAEYDRTMTTSDTNCPIDENSILWVDNADTDEAYNFVVTKRAPWKNSVSFAIKAVTVSQKVVGRVVQASTTGETPNAEDNTQPKQQVD